jgi:hypothetical protein
MQAKNTSGTRQRKSTTNPEPSRAAQLDALKRESERDMLDLIRRRLALPLETRTHFLRKRLPLPGGGSCL